MDRSGIYVLTLLGFLHVSGIDEVLGELTSCEYTGTAYNRIQPRDGGEVPTQPIDGTTLKICQSATTCCTRRMEQQLLERATMDFNSALQSELSYLEYSMSRNALEFHGEYSELLRYGEERLKQYFGTVFTNIAGFLEDDIQQLYDALRDHLRGRPAHVPLAVETFFNELFALLYQDQIDPRNRRVGGFGSRCIAGQQKTIRPFGNIPQEMGAKLYQSVELTRLLLSSLHLGVEVLNSTHHMQVGKKCARALLEMRYCGTCQGFTTVKPCNSYCINVMKGCLANFVDIDADWNEYVTSVMNLIRWSMAKDYDLQVAMHSLDKSIIDAIAVAQEDSERIIEEANNLCRTLGGRPSTAQNRDFAIQQPSLSIPMAPNPNVPLDERLLNLMSSLDSSRMLYSSLSRGLCTEGLMAAAESNDGCWNGDAVDRYSEPIVEDGLAAQIKNPEINWNGRELELLQAMSLMDKLQHVVQSQETWARNQADFIMQMEQDFSGSGSGDGFECSGDGEECEGSGSEEMKMSTMQPDSGENSGEATFTGSSMDPRNLEDPPTDPRNPEGPLMDPKNPEGSLEYEGTTPDSDFTFEPSPKDSKDTKTTKSTKGKGSSNIGEQNPGGGATQTSTVSVSLITIAFLLSWQHLL